MGKRFIFGDFFFVSANIIKNYAIVFQMDRQDGFVYQL
jgi:hypothetical protein